VVGGTSITNEYNSKDLKYENNINKRLIEDYVGWRKRREDTDVGVYPA
jgi:hypothetical protein